MDQQSNQHRQQTREGRGDAEQRGRPQHQQQQSDWGRPERGRGGFRGRGGQMQQHRQVRDTNYNRGIFTNILKK